MQIGIFDDINQWANNTLPDIAVKLSPDYDGMALLLAGIRKAKADLVMAEMYLEDELTKVAPGRQWEVSGLGVVEMHTGATRKAWDKEALTLALTHAIAAKQPNLINEDTGERVNLIDFVRELVAMFTDAAATPSWKVTGLRKYGIDPDEYCEVTWGRKTINTPKLPESTADA